MHHTFHTVRKSKITGGEKPDILNVVGGMQSQAAVNAQGMFARAFDGGQNVVGGITYATTIENYNTVFSGLGTNQGKKIHRTLMTGQISNFANARANVKVQLLRACSDITANSSNGYDPVSDFQDCLQGILANGFAWTTLGARTSMSPAFERMWKTVKTWNFTLNAGQVKTISVMNHLNWLISLRMLGASVESAAARTAIRNTTYAVLITHWGEPATDSSTPSYTGISTSQLGFTWNWKIYGNNADDPNQTIKRDISNSDVLLGNASEIVVDETGLVTGVNIA